LKRLPTLKNVYRAIFAIWMELICPKLIVLDSSTLGFLARHQLTNAAARQVVELLNAGPLLPYLSGKHITELNQHADQNTRLGRMDLLSSLRLVASFSSPEGQPIFGSYGHLQRAEIFALLRDPSLTLDQLVKLVKPIACSGCCSGKELVNANRSPLAYLAYTGAAVGQVSHHPDVASLNQTYGGAILRRRIRREHQYKLPDAARLQGFQRAQLNWLLGRLQELRDPRSQSANRLADVLTRKALDLITTFYQGTDSGLLDDLLRQQFEVEPQRLPSNATFEDAAYEVLFRNQMRRWETLLGYSSGFIYKRIQQSSLPTWIAWRELDSLTRNHGPALGSNIVDLALAVFALYLDYVQVDKRIFDSAGRATKKHSLLSTFQSKMFRTTGRNYQKLYAELEGIANA
jgi:hypothetical protein